MYFLHNALYIKICVYLFYLFIVYYLPPLNKCELPDGYDIICSIYSFIYCESLFPHLVPGT